MASSEYEQDKKARRAEAEAHKARYEGATIENDLNDNIIYLTTTKQKLANFWYHYKFHVIVGILLLAMATSIFFSIFNKTTFDATLTIVSNNSFEGSGDYFRLNIDEVLNDFTMDGDITLDVNPIQIARGAGATLQGEELMANQAKFFATTSDNRKFLYLVDDAGYDELTDVGLTFKDLAEFGARNGGTKYPLKDTRLSEIFALGGLLDNMYLCIVDFDSFEKKPKKSAEIFRNDCVFLRQMIGYN